MGWEQSWSSRPGWSGCRRRRAATRAARCRIRQVPRWAASGSSRTPVAPTCWLVCGSTPRATSASGAQRRGVLPRRRRGVAARSSGRRRRRSRHRRILRRTTTSPGADEPDLVKTDGNRVITVERGVLRIVDTATRTVTARLKLADPHARVGCVESARRGQSRAGDPCRPRRGGPRAAWSLPARIPIRSMRERGTCWSTCLASRRYWARSRRAATTWTRDWSARRCGWSCVASRTSQSRSPAPATTRSNSRGPALRCDGHRSPLGYRNTNAAMRSGWSRRASWRAAA